jgi:Cu(I)-responsive transcriptional regulator
MNISQAAQTSGLSVKAIRYYERVGLIEEPNRSDSGYREYATDDLRTLSFIQHARATGFSVDETRQLLQLYQNTERHSSDVKILVQEKLAYIDTQISELKKMRKTLTQLADACPGDESARCAIIDKLAEQDN